MDKVTAGAIVFVLIVLISVGVYFGTQKKDDKKGDDKKGDDKKKDDDDDKKGDDKKNDDDDDDDGAVTPPPPPPPSGYNVTRKNIIWSAGGTDVDVVTGTIAGGRTPWRVSNMNGTLDQCKSKCDSLSLCKGFSRQVGEDSISKTCWMKTGDGNMVPSSSYDMYMR